jgi:hypothetical protein
MDKKEVLEVCDTTKHVAGIVIAIAGGLIIFAECIAKAIDDTKDPKK